MRGLFSRVLGFFLLCAAAIASRPASAQVAGNVAGNVTGNVTGNVGGNVQGVANVGGVVIDAQGVVRPVFRPDDNNDLARRRRDAVAKVTSADVRKPSLLRKVSLVELEKALTPFADDRKDVTPELNYLAGLQRIDYLFVFPESNDLVIAGPAEEFTTDAVGRVVGVKSGRPPLRLDDLLVALRSVERGGPIGCSIDPSQARMADMQKFLRENNGPGGRDVAVARYNEMARILGNQDVRVFGVPSDSHVAQILVEADYRMKLLALGLEEVNVKGFKSHLAVAPPRARSTQRWWLAPLYEPFRATTDGNAYEFRGQRVQLMSAEEVTDEAGKRTDAAFTRISTQKWAQLFTDKYPEIAAKATVFADLQNVFDMAVLAALLKRERLAEKVGWKKTLFLDAARATVGAGNAPRQVPTAVNYRFTNQGVSTGMVGGGVTLNAFETVRAANLSRDDTGKLGTRRTEAARGKPSEEHPWWWD